LPSQAAGAAGDTLGGAVAAGPQLSSNVLQAATEAFTHGLQVATGTAAILVATVAILAAALLRGRAEAAPPRVRPVALQES
jgi:DHA2 family multidrug resistance protein-like MFS transporter